MGKNTIVKLLEDTSVCNMLLRATNASLAMHSNIIEELQKKFMNYEIQELQ